MTSLCADINPQSKQTKNYRSLVHAVTESLSVRFSPNLLRQSGEVTAVTWTLLFHGVRFPPARVHPGVTQQHRFPAERKVTRLTSSSPLVWREQREEAEAEAEAGECSRNVLLVLLCLSLFDCGDTNSRCAPAPCREYPLTDSHSSCGVIPASTDFTPNEGSRVTGFYLLFFLKNHLDEEKAQSASELLGPDLFSSTRAKLPNSETFPSFPLLLSLISSGTSRWSEMISLVTVTSLTGCPPQTSSVQFVRAAVSS